MFNIMGKCSYGFGGVPRFAWWLVEQQCRQLSSIVSQQQRTRQPQQQQRLPPPPQLTYTQFLGEQNIIPVRILRRIISAEFFASRIHNCRKRNAPHFLKCPFLVI